MRFCSYFILNTLLNFYYVVVKNIKSYNGIEMKGKKGLRKDVKVLKINIKIVIFQSQKFLYGQKV